MICKHCGQKIGQVVNYNRTETKGWYSELVWTHNPDDGPDARHYCGDEYGTDAEPVEQIV